MKKTVLFVWVALIAVCKVSAQEQGIIERLVAKKIDTIRLSTFKVPAEAGTSILVLDYRADTSRVGYQRNFSPFQLQKGTSEGWGSMLSHALSGNGQQGLKFVAVLRNFWVVYYESELTAAERPDIVSKKRNRMVFAADYFVEHDGLWHPFARIDTTLIGAAAELDDESHVIAQLLDWHTIVFKRTDLEKAKKRTGYTLQTIKEKNALPLSPILAKGNGYTKGIYRSFQEFLANEPSGNLEFVFDKQNKTSRAKITFRGDTATGERLLSSEVWGYCDGRDLYIQYANEYYPAARSGNTFEILALATPKSKSWGEAPRITSITGRKQNGFTMKPLSHYVPMQLDIRTGIVY